MKQTIVKFLAILAVLSILSVGTSVARADVDVNINIGVPLPPPVVVATPPTMIFLGTPGVYVAVGVAYDIFFIDSRYYYFHGGNWFWAPAYGGPWVHVTVKSLPLGLRKYKIHQLHDFRAHQYKVFKAKGPKFNGKHFIAVQGPGPKVKKHKAKQHIRKLH